MFIVYYTYKSIICLQASTITSQPLNASAQRIRRRKQASVAHSTASGQPATASSHAGRRGKQDLGMKKTIGGEHEMNGVYYLSTSLSLSSTIFSSAISSE